MVSMSGNNWIILFVWESPAQCPQSAPQHLFSVTSVPSRGSLPALSWSLLTCGLVFSHAALSSHSDHAQPVLRYLVTIYYILQFYICLLHFTILHLIIWNENPSDIASDSVGFDQFQIVIIGVCGAQHTNRVWTWMWQFVVCTFCSWSHIIEWREERRREDPN